MVDWAPKPKLAPTTADSQIGNAFFFGALSWIIRHEIAHVTLQHVVVVDSIQAENDADRQATEWLRGEREADPNRVPTAHPGKMELELEQRAIVAGIGLIWVAMFETAVGIPGKTHPPSAERLFRCFEILNLREDSAAAEILADVLKAWIDPTGNWATGEGHPDTKAALDTALGRLYEILRSPGWAERSTD